MMIESYTNLKKIREENNYSCYDMADKLGISQGFYWQIENKKRKLYYEMAVKIAKIFNLKPDDLFFEK